MESPRGLLASVLCLAVVLTYWNSLTAPFFFDDTGAVVFNASIRHLGSFAVLNPPSDGSTTTGRPIVNLSYAINYAISGDHVWSYHALNLALHAAAALALLGILRRTLGGPVLRPRFGAAAGALAFFIALLWALHPLLTESVVCVAQRTETLCGLFYLLTLYCFIRGAERAPWPESSVAHPGPRRVWFALSFVSCLLGMGTKEVMVTAPLIVLLYDRTFVAQGFAGAWRERRGYYLPLASSWLLLILLLVRGGGARGASAGFGLGISPWTYLLQQCEALRIYLKLSFWPSPLVLDYGTAVVGSLAQVWWQGLAIAALLGSTIWALVRRPVLGFVGSWFFIILAPSSSVVPLVAQTMAEHRMYLPLVAVLSLVGLALYCRLGLRVIGLMAGAVAAFGFVTVHRNHDYRDLVVIWADNVDKFPQNARAHNNLAWALQQQGRNQAANDQFARAVELQPNYVSARYNWGVALLDQGRAADAIEQFKTAVQLAPDHADAQVNLGNALVQVRRYAEAVSSYEQALRLKPGPDVEYNLGVALIQLDRRDEAAVQLRAAVAADPKLAEAHYQLGTLAELSDQPAEAERDYAETLRVSPNHLAAHRKLGLLLARSQRLGPAAEQFQAVLKLRPSDADTQGNLGNVYLLQSRFREAIACYEEALRLRPDDPRTRENLQLAREALH